MSRVTKRLAPWEEITYFKTPTVTVTAMTSATSWVEIAKANPQRVLMLIHTEAATIVAVSPDATLRSGGLIVTDTLPPLEISEAKYGPLATMAWYAQGDLGVNVTVIEVVLRQWPEDQQ